MQINNFRIIFGGEKIDYRSNFKDCRKYWMIIKEILECSKKINIPIDMWFFYEPYVEITWVEYHNDYKTPAMPCISGVYEDCYISYLKPLILEILSKYDIVDYVFYSPVHGNFTDWYFKKGCEKEKEFGYKRYAKIAELSKLYYEYMDEIKNGKGLEGHYVRSCHVLANQLALNYYLEGKYLLKRSIVCFLMWYSGMLNKIWWKLFKKNLSAHNLAICIWTKILRQTY
jgi:hypothetical protein